MRLHLGARRVHFVTLSVAGYRRPPFHDHRVIGRYAEWRYDKRVKLGHHRS